jgi:hypothetical protein
LDEVAAFFDRIEIRRIDQCWIWLSCCDIEGYGRLHWRNSKLSVLAHRAMYLLNYGRLPRYVLHKCGNSSCVNPSHLRSGTQSENMHDAIAAGRMEHLRRGNPKLTLRQVQKIRSLYKGPYTAWDGCSSLQTLASVFNISLSQVHRVVHFDNWKSRR